MIFHTGDVTIAPMKASALNTIIELEAISSALEAASFAFADHKKVTAAVNAAGASIQKALQRWDVFPEQLTTAVSALETVASAHPNISVLIDALKNIQNSTSNPPTDSAQEIAYLQNRVAARIE